MADKSTQSAGAKPSHNQVDTFDELLRPFSIHRSKYRTGIGTVARRDLKRKLGKHVQWMLEQARREGYKAGYSQGQVDFEARIGAEGSDLVRISHDVSTDAANPQSNKTTKDRG